MYKSTLNKLERTLGISKSSKKYVILSRMQPDETFDIGIYDKNAKRNVKMNKGKNFKCYNDFLKTYKISESEIAVSLEIIPPRLIQPK